jgi:hypothetical protein
MKLLREEIKAALLDELLTMSLKAVRVSGELVSSLGT